MAVMETTTDRWLPGTTLWFDGAKHYGFLTGDNGEKIFLHFSVLQKSRIRPLDILAGTRVEYISTRIAGKESPEITKIRIVK